MSRDVRRYLRNPDKLFRRVRDKHGNLRLSKAAKAYHPGRGVYRSSYRNALRLTATENNMAYRTADHLRWQQQPFVVGIEIKLSNNHTCKGVIGRFVDICDDLAGVYPKDFKFVGWHPHCRCYCVPKQASKEEFMEYQQRLLNGEDVSNYHFKGEVKDLPRNFKDWYTDNTDRIARAKSQPYFLRDNQKLIEKNVPIAQYGHKAGAMIKADAKNKPSIIQEPQPSNGIANQMANNHFTKYVEKFKDASPKMEMLYKQLKEKVPGSERAIIINQIKHECASLTHNKLLATGHIGEDWSLIRKEFDAIIQEKATYLVKGEFISLPETKIDLLLYRDPFGREFSYPLGADDSLFKATIASAVIQEFPPYLRKGIKRVSFFDIDCPADPYWKVMYNNPKHRSMATDGGKTTFWGTPSSRESFKGYMSHEAGHILDGTKHLLSSSGEWVDAVSKDDALFAKFLKGKHRVSSYAKTNDAEDFAECIRMYIQDHDYIKHAFPNRAAFIRKMAQKLSGHYKS